MDFDTLLGIGTEHSDVSMEPEEAAAAANLQLREPAKTEEAGCTPTAHDASIVQRNSAAMTYPCDQGMLPSC